MRVIKRDYIDAMNVQSASNLIGLVHSFINFLERLFNDRYDDKINMFSTNDINSHPICRLYAEQIMHLTKGNAEHGMSYGKAYKTVLDVLEGTLPVPDKDETPRDHKIRLDITVEDFKKEFEREPSVEEMNRFVELVRKDIYDKMEQLRKTEKGAPYTPFNYFQPFDRAYCIMEDEQQEAREKEYINNKEE